MNLKIEGIVKEVMPIEVVGTNEKRKFILETSGQYPQLIVFQLFNKTDKLRPENVGSKVCVNFNIKGYKSSTGNVFNTLDAWQIDFITSVENGVDNRADLPF